MKPLRTNESIVDLLTALFFSAWRWHWDALSQWPPDGCWRRRGAKAQPGTKSEHHSMSLPAMHHSIAHLTCDMHSWIESLNKLHQTCSSRKLHTTKPNPEPGIVSSTRTRMNTDQTKCPQPCHVSGCYILITQVNLKTSLTLKKCYWAKNILALKGKSDAPSMAPRKPRLENASYGGADLLGFL